MMYRSNPAPTSLILVIALLMPLSTAPEVRAQQAAGNSVSAAPAAPTPFVDRSFGYQLELPGGWRYDRTAFFGPGGSLGLLRGAAPHGLESLQILLFRNVKPSTMQQWMEYFARQIGGVSGVTGVAVKFSEQNADASGRPHGYLLVRSRDGAERIETLYYCTRFDDSTIWILSKAGVLPPDHAPPPPATGDFEVPAVFQSMVRSLRITYDPAIAEKMRAAVARGKEWIGSFKLQEATRILRLDESIRYYEIRVSDKPVGYLTRRYSREFRSLDQSGSKSRGKKKEGLRINETSWRFGDDGSAIFSLIDLFSSLDGQSDMYEQTHTSVSPPRAEPAANDAAEQAALKRLPTAVTTCDQVLREGDVLFSTFRTSIDDHPPDPREPLKLDPSYLGLTWVRALPALLGREPHEPLGFFIYDTETRALLMHAMQSMGETTLPGGNSKAYLYEVQEGMVEARSRIFVDGRGHLLRMEAGDLVIQLSTEAAVESAFAEKRAAAQKRVPRGK